MRLFLFTAAVAVATTGFVPSSFAQSGSDLTVPAELPPASFTARQYVDSRGCVYARATVNGATTWVPRVGQNREVICGAEPSLSQVADTTSTGATTVPQPVVTSPSVAEPVRTSSPAPASAPKTRSQTVSRHATRSMTAPVVRDRTQLQRATPETVAPNVRIAPRHVVEAQIAARDGVFVPRGYEPVWEDDRLSLTRAHQTYSGQAQMAQFWGNGTPMRLLPREEGASASVSSKGAATSAPVLSTRSSASIENAAPASHRYIEAGAFETEAKARLAANYIAQAGLPAALSSRRYQGRAYATALAGPFSTQEQLDQAFDRIRAVYPNASLKR